MQTDVSRRDRIAHALLAYPFSSAAISRDAVQAVAETMNEWVPAKHRFAGYWTVDSGEHSEADEGEWTIAKIAGGLGDYECLRELEASNVASPEEQSALAVANMAMFGVSYWKCATSSKLLRWHMRAEALASARGLYLDELAEFSRIVSYEWNEDFERKRILGLSLLATSRSPHQKKRRFKHGIDDIKLVAFAWKRLFRMYPHEVEIWERVRVEPLKKSYDGIVFWVNKEPVDAILTRLLEGRLRDSTPLRVGRELLRWMCLPEKV